MPTALIHLSWEQNGIAKNVVFPMTESYTHKDLTLNPSFIALKHGQLFTLQLTPHVPLILTHLSIQLTPEVHENDQMMINGYQSWTQSCELPVHEQIPSLNRLSKHILGPYGDYKLYQKAEKTVQLHSWTYTYFRRMRRPLFMIGSIDESFAFTILDYDFQHNLLIVKKDFERLQVESRVIPFRIYMSEGEEKNLWEEYTSLIPHYRESLSKCTGWTSWYYYYTKITQEIILNNLHALKKANIPLDVFQIDDGYQHAIGDWLQVNTKFSLGMKHIADEIKKAGYRPGLWLAPFICDEKSHLYKEHPEWILRNEKGKPVKAGWNPAWNGWFYALDLYAPGLKEYLTNVFSKILNEWGYQMVKLDFLYAVALQPRADKTRGQIMHEAMNFIRNVIGDKWILGCGVPLGPAFGQVDYCRIGSDVAPYWEDAKLAKLHYRERVSTQNSLYSTISRWQLNNHVFMNDPDVFILRDNNNKLTEEQRYTLFLLNNLFGGLVFFSDHIGEYSEEQLNLLKSMYPTVAPNIKQIINQQSTYLINCTVDDKHYLIYANLTNKPFNFKTSKEYFASDRGYIPTGTNVELKPYESMCLYTIESSKKAPFLLGSTGHLFPGSTVIEFKTNSDKVEIKLAEGINSPTKVYIGVPPNLTYIKVNGKQYSAKLNNVGARYISIAQANL